MIQFIASSMPVSISVVIPVRNGASTLVECLPALERQSRQPAEILVVDDGSTDGSATVAESLGARVIRRTASGGPAVARNAGAAEATGDWILFLDADVVAHADLIGRLDDLLEARPDIDAAIGSYDDSPRAAGFISQFRNLLHHFTHQKGRRDARTFWGACGAVRREVFLRLGGFDESYTAPSIEDIEFGLRLCAQGHRVALEPSMQVCHLKRWTLASMLRTDVLLRAWPWARLMLRDGRLSDDLNTRWSQRWSALLAWLLVITLAASTLSAQFMIPALACLAGVAGLNARFFQFLLHRRGPLFATMSAAPFVLYLLYSSATFAAALAATPFAPPRADRALGRQP